MPNIVNAVGNCKFFGIAIESLVDRVFHDEEHEVVRSVGFRRSREPPDTLTLTVKYQWRIQGPRRKLICHVPVVLCNDGVFVSLAIP